MPTLYHPPCFLTLSSHKLFLIQEECKISLNTHHHPPQKSFRICICSAKKSRSGRKVKSDAELCNDIREFLSAVGLPEDHVPSMKELSDNGRTDLAHIVRRRGYKLLRRLLLNSMKEEIDESNEEKSLAREQDIFSDHIDILTVTGQDEKVEDTSKDTKLPEEVTIIDDHSESAGSNPECNSSGHSSMHIEPFVKVSLHGSLNRHLDSASDNNTYKPMETSVNSSSGKKALDNSKDHEEKVNRMVEDISLSTGVLKLDCPADSPVASLNFGDHSSMPRDSAANSSLEDKVAKFIQSGNLDVTEDESIEESEGVNKPDNEAEIPSEAPYEENFGDAFGRSNAALALNGSIPTSRRNMLHKMVYGARNGNLSDEGPASSDLDKGLHVETSRRENQVEINNLKFMLRQKELELSRLQEQIEKEKLALSDLQSKAEKEISKAQKLISDKDAELVAAEESLSELVEVEIQYCGDGEIVEVAGSFNGWHHPIKLDPQPSSSIVDSTGSRKSRFWSTMLWLYPGVYEIKFIVDGHWKIDPQTESVTRGGICNNILRVVE
ncbi:hypothetical protein MANES_08G011400v8 [Manihot esculenta]|uniref:Uncharacterized protein n=2 Tax=Manihot esculenta TaxID=3983 RepID=A0ACB7HA74_MANES|nr:hypothetical protein MANES_08G011400v8 [Manihot esculenta]KAG8648580.1 hypothetical protein MANES_08G011400v8 [Manihot esculenta]